MTFTQAQDHFRAMTDTMIGEAHNARREVAEHRRDSFDAESHAAEARGDLFGAAFHAALAAVYSEVVIADGAAELIAVFNHDPMEDWHDD